MTAKEIFLLIRERLQGVQPQGEDSFNALCPAHEDRRASLSVGIGRNGDRVVVHCHAGCDPASICRELSMDLGELFASDDDIEKPGRVIWKSENVEAYYDYRDESGRVLYRMLRFFGKEMRPAHPVGPPEADKWGPGIKGIRRVIYHLPEILASKPDEPILIVEGEKDADSARHIDMIATCNVFGAGSWKAEYSESLKGRRVVIVPDNDQKGKDHARDVLASVLPLAKSAVIVELPGLQDKGDLSDWIEAGGTREQLHKLIEDAELDLGELFFKKPIPLSKCSRFDPSAHWIWEGCLALGQVTLLSAYWKSGKTTLLSHMLQALKDGGEFLGKSINQTKTLVFSEEHESIWGQRDDDMAIGDHVHVSAPAFYSRPRHKDWEAILHQIRQIVERGDFGLVIFDTLSALTPIDDENDASQINRVILPMKSILADVAGVVLVHHFRKSDGSEATGSRGSGALTAIPDNIIELRRRNPEDNKDRRRKLTGYGRLRGHTFHEVIELTEADGVERYEVIDDEDAFEPKVNNREVVYGLLPTSPPGRTVKEILDWWPDNVETPTERTVINKANQLVGDGRAERSGSGNNRDPYRFWKVRNQSQGEVLF